MKYIQPKSDSARLAALLYIAQRGALDSQEGRAYLHTDTLAEITTFKTVYSDAYHNVQALNSTRMEAVQEANTAVKAVERIVRRIWNEVKWRKNTENQPVSIFSFYGLPSHGRNPVIRSQDEWLIRAESIIEGEAEAVAAGYAPLTRPTTADLQTSLTAALAAINKRNTIKAAYKTALTSLADLRQQADNLIAQAMGELRLALRKESAGYRRDVMRGYGAHFSSPTEEIIEGEPTETPPAPETAVLEMVQPLAAPNGTAVPA